MRRPVPRSALLALPVLLLAQLAAWPHPAAAQEPLGKFTEQLTLAWARGASGDIAALIAERGVSMKVEGEPAGPLATRQAKAVLRRLFDDVETISVTLTSKKVLPGKPERAYLELLWTRRARGTTIPERATVFVAVVSEPGWRISEIRLLQ
jgi:hypothetical protein